LTTDLQVTAFENTDVQGFPTEYQDPLSEIELALRQRCRVDQQRRLNILLNNLLLCFLLVWHNLVQSPGTVNSPPAGCVAWLHNPNVVGAVNCSKLGQDLV
jgi:hypothetical protein